MHDTSTNNVIVAPSCCFCVSETSDICRSHLLYRFLIRYNKCNIYISAGTPYAMYIYILANRIIHNVYVKPGNKNQRLSTSMCFEKNTIKVRMVFLNNTT